MAKRTSKPKPETAQLTTATQRSDGLKVFISWSGERSKLVAGVLKDWLPEIIEGVIPWVSNRDISAGIRWNSEIDKQLNATNFGIVCLTRENLQAPWILFEAGALAKAVEIARVIPYRLSITAADVEPPLGQFQGVSADRVGTLSLVQSLNTASGLKYDQDRLQRRFDEMWWPNVERKLSEIPSAEDTDEVRTERDILEEVLEFSRDQSRSTGYLFDYVKREISIIKSDLFNPKNMTFSSFAEGGGHNLLDYLGIVPIEETKKMNTAMLYYYCHSLKDWLKANDEADPDEYQVHEELMHDVLDELKLRRKHNLQQDFFKELR